MKGRSNISIGLNFSVLHMSFYPDNRLPVAIYKGAVLLQLYDQKSKTRNGIII